jgi:hypothetical protein
VSGLNRVEYQVGNLPEEIPQSRTSLYNQLNLNYRNAGLSAGIRAEIFNVDQSENAYTQISQKYIRYKTGNLQIQVGNFYEMLGKGLLMRAFDIPGVTYEDRATRERYGFYQDIEGISLRYRTDFVEAKIINGYPLMRTQPPTRNRKTRRPDLVQGGEFNLRLHQNARPGILYLREDSDRRRREFGGFNLSGSDLLGISYYAEYVQDLSGSNDRFALGQKSSHAFYSSLSYFYKWISLSLEYKDYHDFTLGYNEPPSLVKEHFFTLLNRKTHAVEPLDERGFQLETMFNLYDLNTSTLNLARSVSEVGGFEYEFYEIYVDINFYPDALSNLKAFVDLAQDEIKAEYDRYTLGGSYEREIFNLWNIMFDLQTQWYDVRFRFNPDAGYSAKNDLAGITLSRSPDLSVGFVVERSNDRFEVADNKYQYWPGYFVSYNYNQHVDLSLFYGQRRGGNACTGGICYEVQPFEGIEFRMTTTL